MSTAINNGINSLALRFCSLLVSVIMMTGSNTARSQGIPKLLQVNAATEQVTIKNFGDITIDISSYWFCSLIRYVRLNNTTNLTVVSGSLNLAASFRTNSWSSSDAELRRSDRSTPASARGLEIGTILA